MCAKTPYGWSRPRVQWWIQYLIFNNAEHPKTYAHFLCFVELCRYFEPTGKILIRWEYFINIGRNHTIGPVPRKLSSVMKWMCHGNPLITDNINTKNKAQHNTNNVSIYNKLDSFDIYFA